MNSVCPLCGSSSSTEIFRARNQPAMLNRLLPTRDEAVRSRAVDLQFRCCDDVEYCGFVWNAAFDADSVMYAPGYVNDQSQSSAFRAHLGQVRSRIAVMAEKVSGDILEVGCGQGDFLRELCAFTHRGGIGFDPACAAPPNVKSSRPLHRDRSVAHRNGRVKQTLGMNVRLHQAVFDDSAFRQIEAPPSVVICRHVLEHLPNPLLVMKHAARVLHRNGSMYIEVPCVDWIVENGAFFDLFNEHCSLFSPRSLHRALSKAGFSGIRIDHVFGGQYLAAEASLNEDRSSDAPPDSTATFDAERIRQSLSSAFIRFKEEVIEELDARPILIWGAGAKGVSLVNHLRVDFRHIPALIDIHPFKHGRYVPMTGQEVIAPSDIERLVHDDTPLILVMNPNYADEIRRSLSEFSIKSQVRVLDGRPRVALHR